jgi:minor extracellular serine protease Vpr
MNLYKTIPLIITALLLAGCSNKSETNQVAKLISSDLFSDRPVKLNNVAVLIKLKGPSLIEGSTKAETGEMVISQEAKNTILSEQANALAQARALSDDVKLIFSYKFTVNALALSVPAELYDQVGTIGTVAQIQEETQFSRPSLPSSKELINKTVEIQKESNFKTTSVSHIGANKVHDELGIRGKGIKVGIIDTGIDFTHKMMGGSGSIEEYENIDREKATPAFPNKKVVGGYDFAGTNYSPGAFFSDWRIPRPDENPLDDGGHGTHVAGSVAGIGDGVNTYDGVAPDADLYALKVFGNNGGTSDTVVIAAMEWAMDPNGDMNPDDRLDVINLSLGGNYGKPYILYSLAVKNIAKAGMMAVISAGNSGSTPYIVGAPGTAEESISVAASVDGMDKNWKFKTVGFSAEGSAPYTVQRVEGSFTKPIADAPIVGNLVYVGDAASDFDQATIDKLAGNVALIDRGGVSFVEKLNRAEAAGATGAVVANNQPGDAFVMGGEGSADIPGVMITLDEGSQIKSALNKGKSVSVTFDSKKLLEKTELIDTLTGFTSQGPRSEDALLKPEIAAPGFQIISASMGTGDKGVALNGTSMSAPHMAGVMALVKERFPAYTVAQQKAVVMNSATIMTDEKDSKYTITLQGAGLVQTFEALTSKTLVMPASLSLGSFQLQKKKAVRKSITLFNQDNSEKVFRVYMDKREGLALREKTITVPANQSKKVDLKLVIKTDGKQALEFHEGFIKVAVANDIVATVPVLGVSKRISKITPTSLKVSANSQEDSFDAITELQLNNSSLNDGVVELFNTIAVDERKPDAGLDSAILSRSCDLHAVGYRLVEKEEKTMLQLGVKIYSPVSNWQACELSVMIDSDKDGEADQEIGGLPHNYLSGLSDVVPAGFYSVLLDFDKARELRTTHEQEVRANLGEVKDPLSYVSALLDVNPMNAYQNSHLTVIEVDTSKIAKTVDGRINIKTTIFSEGGIESSDDLQGKWFEISPLVSEQSFKDLPSVTTVAAKKSKKIEFTKGHGNAALMMVFPSNLQVSTLQTTNGLGLEVVGPSFD